MTYCIDKPENFNLTQIFDCGQCFRFNKKDENTYSGVAFGKYIEISELGNKVYFNGAGQEDYNNIWHSFLDLDRNYASIISSFSDDKVLFEAASSYPGIRILRQDKWEALCSFIISQNNNIPRIKGIIENMSRAYGEKIYGFDGNEYYSFPTPQRLAMAGVDEIFALKTGFRAKYIYDAAYRVSTGETDLDYISSLNYSLAFDELLKIKGVGPKVASCVLLFGFSKCEAFPVDVWVKRILSTYYADRQSPHFSGDNAGIAQQYLFYYERCKNNVFLS